MSYRYGEAFAEVDYILSGLKDGEREQIPKNLRDVIHVKKAKNYQFNIDLTKSLFEQNLKNETLAVLALIYRKYLVNSEEKAVFEKHYKDTLEAPQVISQKRSVGKFNKSEVTKSEQMALCRVEKISFIEKLRRKWTEIKIRLKKTVK